MNRLALFILCGLMVVSGPSVFAGEQVRFGAWTQIWPAMWRDGLPLKKTHELKGAELMKWNFAVANLKQYAAKGFEWNLVVLRQGRDGPDNWARARAIVEAQRQLGIRTVFRLIEDPAIYLKPVSALNLQSGLLKAYVDWVAGVAQEFSDEVQFYLISNEVDHDIGHNLLHYQRILPGYPHYLKLLNAAYDVIKKQNPQLQVVDHGVSAYSLGLAVADHIEKTQGLRAAYAFWRSYHFDRDKVAGNILGFMRMLSREGSRRRIDIVHASFRSGRADYHQLHWYFGAEALPEVLDWIEAQKRIDGSAVRPLFAAELGYRMPVKKGQKWDGRPANVADYMHYSQQEHASSLIKNIALLLSRGVRDIQYWQVRVHHERDASAQLYLPTSQINLFKPTAALGAYSRLIALLKEPVKRAACTSQGGLENCEIRTTGQAVRILWMRAGVGQFNITTATKAAYDYAGEPLVLPENGRLAVDKYPVILVERTQASAER